MTDLLTVAQVAKRMGVSAQRVRFLIAQGRLPAFKVGAARAWLISEETLARFERRKSGRPVNPQHQR